MDFKEPVLDYIPCPPAEAGQFGIGLIGAGKIVELAHMPAYRKAGYRVLAIADPDPNWQAHWRKTIGLEKIYDDYRRILDMPEVTIVDISIPQSLPVKITCLHDAIDAGKHILVQKPFAMDFGAARAVVEHAQRAGVKLAVNQQGRWAPAYRVTKALIDQGYLGEPYFITIDDRRDYDWPGTNYINMPRMLLIMDAVHYVDEFRWWFGQEPRRVIASLARRPNQPARGEMTGLLALEFDTNQRAAYMASLATPPQSQYHHFRVEGTGGVIVGEINSLWSPGTVRYSPIDSPLLWYEPRLEGAWIPDAFIGSMSELMAAILEEREPTISGEDNLKTLQIIFAAYKSDQLGRAVAPSEISAGNLLAPTL